MTNRVCHFKLVLLGDTAVGKSCLVVRFVRDEYFEYTEPTIGKFLRFDESPLFAVFLPRELTTFTRILLIYSV